MYKLCEAVRANSPPAELDKSFAVFVSNKKRVVPLWRQKAGREEERLVIWDYHVVFIYRPDDRTLVYDLDSELPFPTYFHKVRDIESGGGRGETEIYVVRTKVYSSWTNK